MIRPILLCLFILAFLSATAQEKRLKFIGFSTGVDWIGGKRQYIDGIRPDSYNSTSGKLVQDTRALTTRYQLTARVEIVSKDKKFSFNTGIRYSLISAEVHRPHGFLSDLDFFYFQIPANNNSIDLLRVQQINRYADYIGAPLAVSWYALRKDRFNLYIKGGVNFDYKLSSSSSVYFEDAAMDQYASAVSGRLNSSPQWMNSVGSAVGFSLRIKKMSLTTELNRSFFLGSRTTGITGAQFAIGIQAGLLFQL